MAEEYTPAGSGHAIQKTPLEAPDYFASSAFTISLTRAYHPRAAHPPASLAKISHHGTTQVQLVAKIQPPTRTQNEDHIR
ncbi:hypothetical protein [Tunturibacter empetritectus]|uniref:Uncharacterized protein n=1 Tax=Tunturiibacter lichenicola TaxID=2051959 RepID=A0A7W8J3S0_9BACT|nr:hypothetical protein [Edaphobacter lichenicola]MBB5342129.1 hypothetical protein [Edaphobacter lichenicola]